MNFKLYWGIWAAVMFVSFIVPELVALFTNVRNTLSWTLWNIEGITPGRSQGFASWSALHFLITGVLIVFLVWLIGHLGFGLWA